MRRQAPSKMPVFSHDIEAIDDLSDFLARHALARSIAQALRDSPGGENQSPHVIGVYGSWGSGKSYLLSQTIKMLLEENNADEQVGVVVAIFCPWRYEVEGDLAPGLINSLEDVLKTFPYDAGAALDKPQNPPLLGEDRIRRRAKELLVTLAGVAGLGLTFSHLGPSVGTAVYTILTKASNRILDDTSPSSSEAAQGDDLLKSLDKVIAIRIQMQALVDAILEAAKAGDTSGRERSWRLVVFIDDLDRCAPENMVRMFEWLKMHLVVERCTYVIALDHKAAARAIVGSYRDYIATDEGLAYGYRYLEKLIDIEYELDESPNVELMALREIYGSKTPFIRVSDAVRAEYGGDFPGIAFMNALTDLRSLHIARTLLKIVYKFRSSLQALVATDATQLRNTLPASYPFWLLFLTAMYYRLDPDELSEFVHGHSNVYALLRDSESVTEREWGNGPEREFCQFAVDLRRVAGSNIDVPSPQTLQTLLSIVRQNTLPI